MMGFSPGEFKDRGESVHWEGKGDGRIILWNWNEFKVLLELPLEEARKASSQLALLVAMAEDDHL